MARISWSFRSLIRSGINGCSLSRMRGAYTESHLLAGSRDDSFSNASQAFWRSVPAARAGPHVWSQGLVPVLGLIGNFDELNNLPVTMSVRSRLVPWKAPFDV